MKVMKQICVLLLIVFSINCKAQVGEKPHVAKYETAYNYLKSNNLYKGRALSVFDSMVAIDKCNFWEHYRQEGQSISDIITHLKGISEQAVIESDCFDCFYDKVPKNKGARAMVCFSDVYENTVIGKVSHCTSSGMYKSGTQYPNGCNYYLFVFDNGNNLKDVVRMGVTCQNQSL